MDTIFNITLKYMQTKCHKYGTRPLAYGIFGLKVLVIMNFFAATIAFIIGAIFTVLYLFLGTDISRGDTGIVLGATMISLVVLWNIGWVVYWLKQTKKKYNLLEMRCEHLEHILLKKGFMKIDLCQSCGMPINPDTYGTNADGSKNEDYCNTCYKDGAFTTDCTMDMMIDYTSQFVNEYNESTGNDLTCKEYKEELRKVFPNFKRWQQTNEAKTCT